jgi:hypothetical protein
MALDAAQLQRLQTESFRKALHLSGYGNTLFGCCLELDVRTGRAMEYFPHGRRLIFEVIDERGCALPVGEIGRVRFTRLDESMLIVRMLERDEAELLAPPAAHAASGFVLPGLRDPRASLELVPQQRPGLY